MNKSELLMIRVIAVEYPVNVYISKINKGKQMVTKLLGYNYILTMTGSS